MTTTHNENARRRLSLEANCEPTAQSPGSRARAGTAATTATETPAPAAQTRPVQVRHLGAAGARPHGDSPASLRRGHVGIALKKVQGLCVRRLRRKAKCLKRSNTLGSPVLSLGAATVRSCADPSGNGSRAVTCQPTREARRHLRVCRQRGEPRREPKWLILRGARRGPSGEARREPGKGAGYRPSDSLGPSALRRACLSPGVHGRRGRGATSCWLCPSRLACAVAGTCGPLRLGPLPALGRSPRLAVFPRR